MALKKWRRAAAWLLMAERQAELAPLKLLLLLLERLFTGDRRNILMGKRLHGGRESRDDRASNEWIANVASRVCLRSGEWL